MKFSLALLLAMLWLPLHAGTASGTLTINGEAIDIRYAYAVQLNPPEGNSAPSTVLLLSSRPLPPAVVSPELDLYELYAAGIRGAFIELNPDATSFSATVLVRRVKGPALTMGKVPPGSFERRKANRLRGNFQHGWNADTNKFQLDVQIDTEITIRAPDPPPTPEDTLAAQQSEVTKAYLSYVETAKKGDVESIFKAVVPERAARFRDPLLRGDLVASKSTIYTNLKVLKVTRDGDTARLRVTGVLPGPGDPVYGDGTITMQRINGRWLLQRDYWAP